MIQVYNRQYTFLLKLRERAGLLPGSHSSVIRTQLKSGGLGSIPSSYTQELSPIGLFLRFLLPPSVVNEYSYKIIMYKLLYYHTNLDLAVGNGE